MLVAGLAFALDLAEVMLGTGLSSVFSAAPHRLGPDQLGLLLGAPFAGAAVGAPLFGWIAGRRGPVRTLAYCTLWLAVASVLTSLSGVPGQLTATRFLAGISLGAYPPVMAAYLANIAPPRASAALMFGACGIAYLVAPLALFALRGLTPVQPMSIEAWRWVFGVIAALALASSFAFRWLPEAPAWLERRQLTTEAEASLARLDRSGRAPKLLESILARTGRTHSERPSRPVPGRTAAILAMFALQPIAGVAFPLLTGPMLLARGVSLTGSLNYVAIAAVGPAVGALTLSLFIDRMPRWSVVACCAASMALLALLFVLGSNPGAIAMAVLGYGVFNALETAALFLFAAATFPLERRAHITGVAFGLSRIVAAVAPYAFLPLVRSGRSDLVISIIETTLVATILLAAAVRD